MTPEQLNSAWAAEGNEISIADARSLTTAFLSEIRSRRARTSLGLATVAVAFLALTALSIAAVVTQDDLGAKHAWMFAGMNAVLWIGWAVALVRHVSPERVAASAGKPVRDALQHALQQRLAHRGHLRIIAGGMLLTVPLVAFSLHQMVETGRLAPADVPLRIVFALAAYAIAFACLGADYFGRSAEDIEELRGLVAECDHDASVRAKPE